MTAAPQSQQIQLPENVGFGGANNAGVQVASGRYLFFLNPDTVLLNPAIDLLAEYMDAHPETAVAGGNLFDAALSPAHSYMRLFPSLRLSLIAMAGNRVERWTLGRSAQFNYTDNVVDVAYITGADLMVRASVFEQVGGFDSRFFMYYEETDLCKRIALAGHAVQNVPDARIQHFEGVTFSASETRESMKAVSRKYYYRKHLSGVERNFAIFVEWLNAFLRVIAFCVLRKREKYEYWKIRLKYA